MIKPAPPPNNACTRRCWRSPQPGRDSPKPVVPSALPICTPASSARNVPVRRAYPQPVACRSGVPDGRNRCRKRSVVPIARIMAGHPCGTVATAPAWAVVPPARITAGHPCGTVVTAPAWAVVPITRITAEPYKNIQIYI
jgi:hypothetical protein